MREFNYDNYNKYYEKYVDVNPAFEQTKDKPKRCTSGYCLCRRPNRPIYISADKEKCKFCEEDEIDSACRHDTDYGKT